MKNLRRLHLLIVISTFFFVLSFSKTSFASGLEFRQWSKKVMITYYGQEVEEQITVRADLPKNQLYTGWSYIFDKSNKVKILEAKISREGSYLFKDNKLVFSFDGIENNEKVTFFIRYERFANENEKYIVSRFVGFPDWANGVNATLSIKIPDNMTLYSFHPMLMSDSPTTFHWSGLISGENNFRETLQLTPKSAKFHVEISGNAIGMDNFGEAELSIPMYFRDAPYTVEENSKKITTSTKNNYKIKEAKGYYNIDFKNVANRLLSAKVEANVEIGEGYTKSFDFSPYIFRQYDKSNSPRYFQIINNIKNEKNPLNLSDYQRIAMWVHNYLTYDESLLTKNMSASEILSRKRGVCSHYSTLYTELMRYTGTPTFSVSGLSYNVDKKEFENHSWNYIFINDVWIPIDPTWGIYSGKLPVSHIYTYPAINDVGVEFTAYNYKHSDSIQTNIRSTVEQLD